MVPGGAQGRDIPFIYGVLKVLIAEGWYDGRFVEGQTVGFEELKQHVEL